ncbi:MAG: hypothetical protein WCW56_01715 [Candidatus Paceibacterota bacterium]|jgi:ribulose-phosphate 3-epimerase
MSVEIIPSIVSRDFADLEKKIKILDGRVTWAEIDVADGVFASNVTFQEPAILNELDDKIKIAVHLMVELPETVIEEWLAVADRVIIHYEATDDLVNILEKYQKPHQEIVVALALDTPVEVIAESADQIKTIQLMSIAKLGFQGEDFCPVVIDKIEAIKAKWPNLKIVIDGGIGLDEARDLISAGADGLVVGSAIWGAIDPLKALKELQSLK